MSGGWFKCPADAWALVRERLTDDDDPWPEDLIRADLIWWHDRVRMGAAPRVPGYRQLMADWSVGEWTARRLMRESTTAPTSHLPPQDHRTDLAPQDGSTPEIKGKPPHDHRTDHRTTTAPTTDTRVHDRLQTTDTDTDTGSRSLFGEGQLPTPPTPRPKALAEALRVMEAHRDRWRWSDTAEDVTARWASICEAIPARLDTRRQLAEMDGWLAEHRPPKRKRGPVYWRRLRRFLTGPIAQKIAAERPIGAQAPPPQPGDSPTSRRVMVQGRWVVIPYRTDEPPMEH